MKPVPKKNFGSLFIGTVVALVGGLALWGWLFDFSFLARMLSGIESMAPNTALAFVLAGVWVVLAAIDPQRPVLIVLGAAVCALATSRFRAWTAHLPEENHG
ncbi:hypothetical protein SCD_n02284 [Sulfuricella denitrificans skB26]|uniref:Transmembrane protein n=1 Tax=Sulfuricella denitrificans (strain DSM 22764 / NBRC 105220 / skB26) TaxID=1163617 RepID=S6B6G1_SULDS|nr:hypothetical protein SCD_n02284 [Sulfuricella denitrificans skB26]